MERRFARDRNRGIGVAEGDYFYNRNHGSKFPIGTSIDARIPAERNKSGFQPKSSFYRKEGSFPMQKFMEKEHSKAAEGKRPPPGIIARLMGLDSLPTSESTHQRQPESCFPKLSMFATRKSNLRLVDQSSRLSHQQQELKDVFEVSESLECGRNKKSPSAYSFLSPNLSDSTGTSTAAKLCSYNEKPASEAFDFKGHCLSKFDHRHLSLHADHLDVSSNTASLPDNITILKSSKPAKIENNETCYKLDRENERYDVQTDIKQWSPHTDKPSLRSTASPMKLPISKLREERGAHPLPTRIVILKPSHEKAESTEDVFPSFDFMRGSRIRFGNQDRGDGRFKLVSEAQKIQKMLRDTSPLRKKIQSSSELWNENEEIPGDDGDLPKLCASKQCGLPQPKSVRRRRRKPNAVDSIACDSVSNDGKKSYHGSQYTAESSVSKETIRHLSNPCVISQGSQNAGNSSKSSSSTLGEMLARSDRENPYKKYMEAHYNGDYSFGISSRDGWKNTKKAALHGFSSPPSSSLHSKTEKLVRQSTDDEFGSECSSRQKNYPIKKAECSYLLPRKSSRGTTGYPGCKDAVQFIEDPDMISATRDTSVSDYSLSFGDRVSSDSEFPASDTDGMECTSDFDVGRVIQESFSMETGGNTNAGCRNINISSAECALPDHGQANSSSNGQVMSMEFLPDTKDAEQTSPISVLDSPDMDTSLSPDCFSKVNADLHELRSQLRLLKSESELSVSLVEESEIPSNVEGCEGFPEIEDLLFYTDEEERDFSYVLGILTDSGFHGAPMDMIFNMCYLPSTPIDPRIFEKLEKVFDEPEVWSRSDRKLLFDLTNDSLSEFLAPNIDLHPWVGSGKIVGHIPNRKVLAEEVWRYLVRRRMVESSYRPAEPFTDADWMDVRGNIDFIGRHVEKMIREELLEELVSDIIFRSVAA